MKELIICFIAGAGAGLSTGFAGISAASVIAPMLYSFLGIDPYISIGIALASDVLASAISAWTYKRNGNIDIKHSLWLFAAVIISTVAGSILSRGVPTEMLGGGTIIAIIILGIKFIVRPIRTEKEAKTGGSHIVKSIISGLLIGFIAGFMGSGGGVTLLFALTSILGYSLKTAVGTSTFIMTFCALTGAVSHFKVYGAVDGRIILVSALCIAFTLVWARAAAVIANKMSEKAMNRAVGIVLITLGIFILLFKILS